MYRIEIKKEIISKLNNNERIEDGKVFKYLSSKSSVLEYCYKNKIDTYYKEDTLNTWQPVKVQQLNDDIIYIIYDVIKASAFIENNQEISYLYDLKYNNEFYNLDDIASYFNVSSSNFKQYTIESIEEIEERITNNNLHLLKDRFIIFKEIESEV